MRSERFSNMHMKQHESMSSICHSSVSECHCCPKSIKSLTTTLSWRIVEVNRDRKGNKVCTKRRSEVEYFSRRFKKQERRDSSFAVPHRSVEVSVHLQWRSFEPSISWRALPLSPAGTASTNDDKITFAHDTKKKLLIAHTNSTNAVCSAKWCDKSIILIELQRCVFTISRRKLTKRSVFCASRTFMFFHEMEERVVHISVDSLSTRFPSTLHDRTSQLTVLNLMVERHNSPLWKSGGGDQHDGVN